MGTSRTEEHGSRSDNRLTVKLQFGGKGFTVRISPAILLLLMVSGFCSYKIVNMETVSRHQRQASKIQDLELENRQLEASLAHREDEREQMVSLAEARSQELWAEVESRDKEIERLWKIVGQKPTIKSRKGSRSHKSLLSSRYGQRRNALAVKSGYSQLETHLDAREKDMEVLQEAAQEYRERKAAEYKAELASRTPSIWPCKGDMTSGYGNRIHPVYGYAKLHAGCDFTTPHGTPIQATAAGTVIHSDWMGGYGKVIEIDHGNNLTTLYAHCSELVVKKGQKVHKGQMIAKVGTTGLSSGPHCHYEVSKNKKQIDPAPFLKQKDAPKPLANLN